MILKRYLNRRISNSEYAKRVSNMDNKFLSRVVNRVFYDTVKNYNKGCISCAIWSNPSCSTSLYEESQKKHFRKWWSFKLFHFLSV